MSFIIIMLCIALLIFLISVLKTNTFLAFILTSITAGILLGIPITKIPIILQKGIGDMLGSLMMVLLFGAMIGKLVAVSGAAQQISSVVVKVFGEKYITWAMMLTGFIVGIPLFYNVGFVLLVPLIFSIVYQLKLPAVYIGIPMLAALSVTHGLLPPLPSPAALVNQLGANMGKTLIFGFLIAVPTIILAGPIFASTLKKINTTPLQTFSSQLIDEKQLPGFINSITACLLPVFILVTTSILGMLGISSHPILMFIADPSMIMLVSLLYATFTIGILRGITIGYIMQAYAEAIKDILLIIMVIAGAGALKQVFIDSGVSNSLANAMNSWNLPPLFLGWLIAAAIRVTMGSATVAGLTTAGIVGPLVLTSSTDPNLMVLAVGSGSLMFSHVNDSGFWMFKEYFNLSMKDTFRSWSLMETIVSVMGLIGVLLIDQFI